MALDADQAPLLEPIAPSPQDSFKKKLSDVLRWVKSDQLHTKKKQSENAFL